MFRFTQNRRIAVAALAVAALSAPLLSTVGAQAAAPAAEPGAPTLSADATSLGAVTGFERDGDTYTFRAGAAALRVTAEDTDLLHVEMAPDGTFTDPAGSDPADPTDPDADIVVKSDYPGGASSVTTSSSAYVIRTGTTRLTVTRNPITLTLTRGGKTLFAETAPLSWDEDGTTQHLGLGATEQFFGGGMQNGRFSHRGTAITISRDYNWNDGGNPNAAPFYLSSNGYGVLRNTFAPGSYDFGTGDAGDNQVATTHDEQRFDAYYFVGDAEQAINGYTELTGRPMAVPMYALEIGDADCYLHNANRGERKTLRDARAVAEGYRDNGMPLGWMLVNDGYGCGYEDLPETGDMLQDNGSELGLWTESDLTSQESEVAAGVRVRKTDVAWVGPGYRFALDACEQSRDGIQDNSADRATVITVEGWAGTQRCAAVWSGDQTGTFEYIRWQIPTYAGSTMSGQHLATGDVDGIFGGSAKTYVRDLQWKMFLPMTYAMSGWANSDKQPWRYGQPYTQINKDYLLLHERLLPYLYTHTMNATSTGVGAVKPLYLNYPTDPKTWGDDVKYEFLSGDDFLVAPVYEDSSTRDGIYLPKGTWVDYWTGRTYQGPTTIDGYSAPLDTLPLFVRAGAIVPMFPEGTTDWKQGKDSGRLDLDVYPQGSSTFTNHEDDGRSQSTASAKQTFTVTAPARTRTGEVAVRIGALRGSYAGKPATRAYGLTVHTDSRPSGVTLDGQALTPRATVAALEAAGSGWAWDASTRDVRVLTPSLPTSGSALVTLADTTGVGGRFPRDANVSAAATTAPLAVPGAAQDLTVTFTNGTAQAVDVTNVTPAVPAGWTAAAQGPKGSSVDPGDAFSVRFRVTAPDDAAPGAATLAATVAYKAHGVPRTAPARTSTTVAYADLAAAADNVGVAASADPTKGDIDGGGSSFIAERLAEKGVTPGAALSLNGFDFTWPSAAVGTPDNATGQGQIVPVSGEGNTLAFLGTGTSGSAGGNATVHYADGTTATSEVGFPNWCCLATDTYGARIAVSTKGKNTDTGPAYPTTDYRLYTATVRLDPAKQVVAVSLPDNAAFHVFALSVGSEEVVAPPLADGQYSFTTQGGALAAPGQDAAQLTVATASSSPTQKWTVARKADGSYEIKNAGSGQCIDVGYSSQTSGDPVGQYQCTGNPNQRWVITDDAGSLTIAAKHSGLSLSVGAGGKVVQATDTGAATQRWSATAN